jgi:hypothetical protein
MTDDVIPELQLGYARLGGYKAATALANLNTARDATSAWIVAERGTGLIRNMTSKQVVVEYGAELMDLNDGKRVTAADLGKGGWWKSRTGLAKNETLAQAFDIDRVRGLKLGENAFIVHRQSEMAAMLEVEGLPFLEDEEEEDSDSD